MMNFQRNGHNASILVKRAGNACASIIRSQAGWQVLQHGAALESSGSIRSVALSRSINAQQYSSGGLPFLAGLDEKNYESLLSAMQALVAADPKTEARDCSVEARDLLASLCKWESPNMLTNLDIDLVKMVWKPKHNSPHYSAAWISSRHDFNHLSSFLCGQMVSLDADSRKNAAIRAKDLLRELPKFLKNDPTCKEELSVIESFITKVALEDVELAENEVTASPAP